MKTLLIDNYDSFTFNLYQLLAEVNGVAPIVIKNDELSWPEIHTLAFDNIVLSPGPGNPSNRKDFGVCADIIQKSSVPILGVCLGHQGIAHQFGAEITQAAEVMHGRKSAITHQGDNLFADIPSPFFAVRYHSLVVSKLPECFQPLAWSNDGLLMALKHKVKPLWGVQFHPESICTEYGRKLLENFRDLSFTALSGQLRPRTLTVKPLKKAVEPSVNFKIVAKKMSMVGDGATIYRQLFARSEPSFWLDSALLQNDARFSFMGDAEGPLAKWFDYNTTSKILVEHKKNTAPCAKKVTSLFDYFNEELGRLGSLDNPLPFAFTGGFVGYLGYEIKAECGYPSSVVVQQQKAFADATFIFSDRFLAIDHQENAIYLVALSKDGATEDLAINWIANTEQLLLNLIEPEAKSLESDSVTLKDYSEYHVNHEYLQKISEIKAKIKLGETYEACLTNQLSIDTQAEPLLIYEILRKINPAPYACFLKFDSGAILSASPEKFLTISENGKITTKPIKGTRPRGVTAEQDEKLRFDLANSEKDHSENLMIVDLLRNDLGSVAKIGSVKVEKLFNVETYASVHQLVSTVTAELASDKTLIDCVRACFPGGSMTGAPKKRTLEILDRLECMPRGIYSGAIGYFGLNNSADLNIVIRTLVMPNNELATLGVGGAIVDLSDPAAEIAETHVKARALLQAIFLAEQVSMPETTDPSSVK